jgi:SAM-dependent methyltransferase
MVARIRMLGRAVRWALLGKRSVTPGGRIAGSWPPVGSVDLSDLDRPNPISDDWGFDRGTPVDRHFIHGFLETNATAVHGRVLEIDTRDYTLAYGGARVTQSDVLHLSEYLPGVTMVGDLAGENSLPSGAFDCVILTQTLQLIFDPVSAVRTVHRILRPGGTLLATFPGISQITGDEAGRWGYFWGFTNRSARRVLSEVFGEEHVEITAFGNAVAATAFLYGLAAEEIDPADLGWHDPDCPMLYCARATRR